MIQLLNSRNDPLKETQSDILQMNVTNSVLTDNKDLDSDFKEIEKFVKKYLLWQAKNRTYAETILGTKHVCGETVNDAEKIGKRTKNIYGETVRDAEKIGKSTLGKKDHKVVRNESIILQNIFTRLAEASSFSKDPPSPPNLCTDTSVVQNFSSSVRRRW